MAFPSWHMNPIHHSLPQLIHFYSGIWADYFGNLEFIEEVIVQNSPQPLTSIYFFFFFFFFFNVDMQASLNMPRLIPRTLKLTIIQASNDPEVYKTRTGKQDQNLTNWATSLRVSNTSISETSLELKLNTSLCFLLKNILK